MVLGYLLGRAGVRTVVLEKHADFLRDFRGDTVHPSTLRILQELGLLEEFLRRPHSEVRALSAEFDDRCFEVADFGRLPPPCNFIACMPQWDFLDFLADKGRRFAALEIRMSSRVTELLEAGGRVTGVRASTPEGPLEVRADLVVGCDGRSSTVRAAAGLEVQTLGAPIDVLWFRLSKKAGDPEHVLAHVGRDKMLVTIDRTEYWQCAYVIGKGGIDRIHAAGLEAFRRAVAESARFLADRVTEIRSFDEIKLLSVAVDRLRRWSRPGLLCIGDAAHAMSPIGGVGINLAVQDAAATANLLAATLRVGAPSERDLDRVRRRRLFPVRVIQRGQVAVQNGFLSPLVSGAAPTVKAPLAVRLLDRCARLRRWPARVIGIGVRPEHVSSPQA
jgi:2-polyprenyl-6-methoxyphenol hydroxylase-like FAD-dependent oxidoreductase